MRYSNYSFNPNILPLIRQGHFGPVRRRFSVLRAGESAPVTGYPDGEAGAGVFQTMINRILPHDSCIDPILGGAKAGGVSCRTDRY